MSNDDIPLHFEGNDDVVSEKVIHFEGKNKDLNQLSQQIIQKLSSEGYKTQSTNNPMGIIIQAQKAGVLRGIIDSEQSVHYPNIGRAQQFRNPHRNRQIHPEHSSGVGQNRS